MTDTPPADDARRRRTARAIIAALAIHNLTQSDIATAWGISRDRVNHLVHGRRPMHPVEADAFSSLLIAARALRPDDGTPHAADLHNTHRADLRVIVPSMVARLNIERGPRSALPADPGVIRALAEAAR